jgi:hypothetical protein
VNAVYHPAFKASYDEAFAWYRKISPNLGDRFSAEVRHGVSRLLDGKALGAVGPHGFRCHRCKKFPYLIYYEVTGDTALFLAVIYVGRDPDFLRTQLSGFRGKIT